MVTTHKHGNTCYHISLSPIDISSKSLRIHIIFTITRHDIDFHQYRAISKVKMKTKAQILYDIISYGLCITSICFDSDIVFTTLIAIALLPIIHAFILYREEKLSIASRLNTCHSFLFYFFQSYSDLPNSRNSFLFIFFTRSTFLFSARETP